MACLGLFNSHSKDSSILNPKGKMASRNSLLRLARICRLKPKESLFSQCPCQKARYHSYQHPSPPSFSSTAESILSAAIKHVPQTGFTNAALQMGAKDAGFMPISTNLFPRGVFDLIAFYLITRRLALQESVNGTKGSDGLAMEWAESKLGIGSRVRSLLLLRLKMNQEADIIQKWPEALAIMAQPSYVPPSIKELSALSDEIWFLAGDTSVDMSWYSKRATLSALYAAAELYQTQDTSHEYSETERFVDSRLREIAKLGQTMSAVGEWTNFTAHSFVNILRSKGVRI